MLRPPFFYPLILLFAALVISCGYTKPEKVPPPSPEALEQKVVTILELPTFEQNYREVIYLGDKKAILNVPTRDFRVLFSLDIQLEAGIDLSKPWEIKTDGWEELIITLPEPQILSIDADESTIHQYFIKEWGWGESFGRMDLYEEINHAKTRVKDEAIKRGVLDNARNNAETLVRQLFLMTGFDTVIVRTGGTLDG